MKIDASVVIGLKSQSLMAAVVMLGTFAAANACHSQGPASPAAAQPVAGGVFLVGTKPWDELVYRYLGE